jgi:hypothetical protein
LSLAFVLGCLGGVIEDGGWEWCCCEVEWAGVLILRYGLVLSHGCVLVSGLSGYIFVTRTSICDSS